MSPWKQLEKLRIRLKKAKRRNDVFAIEAIRAQIAEVKAEMRAVIAGQDSDPNPCFE